MERTQAVKRFTPVNHFCQFLFQDLLWQWISGRVFRTLSLSIKRPWEGQPPIPKLIGLFTAVSTDIRSSPPRFIQHLFQVGESGKITQRLVLGFGE